MDVKNHNMNKEKPIMRKRLKVIAFLAFFLGIVLAVSQYFGFVSKTVYEESVSHLTEVFHQSDNMLRELSNKNLTYLHMWSKYLQDAPSESKIRDYIDKAQKDAGFLYFYFLLSKYLCFLNHIKLTHFLLHYLLFLEHILVFL